MAKAIRKDLSGKNVTDGGGRSPCLRLRHANVHFDLKPGEKIGRAALGKEFLARFGKVSRQHAQVFFEVNRWFIQDLESPNGTWLNGRSLDSSRWYELQSGDILRLGPDLEFMIFVIHETVNPSDPQSEDREILR